MVFLGTTSTPQEENPNQVLSNNDPCDIGISAFSQELDTPFESNNDLISYTEAEPEALEISSIPYAEIYEEIILGFDTAAYLPENFDPNTVYVDLKAVPYLEMADFENLGFETANYLPASFDPYGFPTNFMDISFIEGEEEVDLGFDTTAYLPEGYNAFEKELDLDSIIFIEEEDLRFGYRNSEDLPLIFNM